MSTRGINLLPHADDQSRYRRRIVRGVQLVLLAVIAVLVIVWFWFMSETFVTNRSIGTVEQQINAKQRILSDQSSKEQQYQLLVNRINEASRLLHNQTSTLGDIQRFVDSLPEDISLVSMEIRAGDIVSKITLEASTLGGYSRLIELLDQSDYDSVAMVNGGRLKDGIFRVSLAVSPR